MKTLVMLLSLSVFTQTITAQEVTSKTTPEAKICQCEHGIRCICGEDCECKPGAKEVKVKVKHGKHGKKTKKVKNVKNVKVEVKAKK